MKYIREKIKQALPEEMKYKYRVWRKYLKKRRLEKQYSGSEVICLICNREYRIFESFKNIENEKCINCISMKRHRLLYKYLDEETKLFKLTNEKIKLLHFAPEKAFYDIFSNQENLEYYPCDLDPKMYHFYRRTEIYKQDITDITFKDETFDVILCNHVLEHIIDDVKAMQELHRVLKKDGWGIFQVPVDFNREETYEDFSKTTPEERYVAFGQLDHVRWYGKDYPERLRKAGFSVSEIKYTDHVTSEEKFRYGFPEEEFIYLCKKQ